LEDGRQIIFPVWDSVGGCLLFRYFGYSYQCFGFGDRLVLAAVFLLKNKIYLVYGLAVQPAVGAKAKHGVGIGIDLHAWRFVLVEGAAQHFVFVRL
jgi:hypothetical protein